jgi:sulfur-carrier protein
VARIAFTRRLRHVAPSEPAEYPGATLRAVLDNVAADFPRLTNYVLDDQGRVRQHVAVFVNGTLAPRDTVLDLPLHADTDVYVMQALSGG